MYDCRSEIESTAVFWSVLSVWFEKIKSGKIYCKELLSGKGERIKRKRYKMVRKKVMIQGIG